MAFSCTPKASNLGLQFSVAEKAYNFNRAGLKLLGYMGTGHENISRIYQKSAAQRGATDRGYSQGTRELMFTWQLLGRGLAQYYNELRGELMIATRPRNDDPILITFDVPGKGKRAAYANLADQLEFAPSDRKYTLHNVTAIFECPDVRMFDPAQQSVEFFPSPASVSWLVPWTIPWNIGNGGTGATTTINYASGDEEAAPEYPDMRLYAPYENPTIINYTTNERLSFDGLFGFGSDFVDIQLSGGPFIDKSPTIRDQSGRSVENLLTTDSDIGTFHLAPAGEKLYDGTYATGDNVIGVDAANMSPLTKLTLSYYNQYIGF